MLWSKIEHDLEFRSFNNPVKFISLRSDANINQYHDNETTLINFAVPQNCVLLFGIRYMFVCRQIQSGKIRNDSEKWKTSFPPLSGQRQIPRDHGCSQAAFSSRQPPHLSSSPSRYFSAAICRLDRGRLSSLRFPSTWRPRSNHVARIFFPGFAFDANDVPFSVVNQPRAANFSRGDRFPRRDSPSQGGRKLFPLTRARALRIHYLFNSSVYFRSG